MLSIEKHYTKLATIKRMTDIVTTEQQELVELHVDVPCHVQPLQDSFTEDVVEGYGKDFLMYCAVLDIQQGDRAFVDGNEYRIMSIEKYGLRGSHHLEARIRIFEDNV